MKKLADAQEVGKLVSELAGKVSGRLLGNGGKASDWALVGIRNRGDKLAERLAKAIGEEKFADRVGVLDITLYRDDLSEVAAQPIVQTTEIPFSVDGKDVVLVDDVLMTGRSVRAALASLMDFGRPKRVWLAVLVDRGGRELPIRADFVGLDLSKGAVGLEDGDHVQVLLDEVDEVDAIEVREAN
ncbi:Bifunctional protein PyrR [Poriferisphaera corsica]|uniref:Bifunctional protein PyrR n=1 Tax=Poriferisphaera corsica TaxID=2528020 RepID=A0A517YTF6_9BACT|nr:bifunctional pyr operon transcriptional regulator/uracil phosphoribosyltransferase PyrR [Poriferisphaera corsica]QDU33515.1 Bifunctional protein PyrR [Poriferisphaera corsica]